jgi:RNA-directed DNA polymerase
MTTPRYVSTSCAAMSQVLDRACSPDASAPSDYAWNVNFNNGNSDYNNQNNQGLVRPVRSVSAREYQGATFRALFDAWQCARRHKVPSDNQLAFESNWIDGLLKLQVRSAGTWSPRPSTCFIAQRPKAREIHAPDFADRVVHHWFVPQLEALYERGFIFDSYANRVGKGTHAAVDRCAVSCARWPAARAAAGICNWTSAISSIPFTGRRCTRCSSAAWSASTCHCNCRSASRTRCCASRRSLKASPIAAAR